MPDRIEEILKEIHVMFAKCEPYQNSPDEVIISKHDMFELLEQLNEALYAVMDKYEATSRSREKARLEMDRQAAEIVSQAKNDAEDVHAATLMYTDTMLGEVNDIVEKTKSRLKHEMVEMIAALELQQETLTQNKESVQAELTELHNSELYLELLGKLRKRAEDKFKFGEDAPEEEIFPDEKPVAQNLVIRVDRPGENSGVTITNRRTRNKKKKPAAAAAPTAEHEEGTPFCAEDFDLDGEYEQWKAEQDGESEAEQTPKKKWSLFGKK